MDTGAEYILFSQAGSKAPVEKQTHKHPRGLQFVIAMRCLLYEIGGVKSWDDEKVKEEKAKEKRKNKKKERQDRRKLVRWTCKEAWGRRKGGGGKEKRSLKG